MRLLALRAARRACLALAYSNRTTMEQFRDLTDWPNWVAMDGVLALVALGYVPAYNEAEDRWLLRKGNRAFSLYHD